MNSILQKTKRDFILGDKWAYFKIYTGYKTADIVITDIIKPLVNELFKKNIIDRWFFIRYSDPDFHLRIRFRLIDTTQYNKLILLLNFAIKPFIENMQISKFQADTYSRELERYGNNTIDYSELLFFNDSEMVINMIDMIEGDEGEHTRWHFALKALDTLLDDFSFTENQKYDLLNNMQVAFGSEFGMNKDLKIQIDRKFRNKRKTIHNILCEDKILNTDYSDLFHLIEQRSKKNTAIIQKLQELNNNGSLKIDINNLISSYIHMMMNRIFKSNQRLNEMIIYALLYRYYKSEIARKNNKK